jgi:stage III sporulation protein AD
MDMIRIAAVGVMAVLVSLCFRRQKPEYATLIQLACCVVIFASVLGKVQEIFALIGSFSVYVELDQEYLATILKMMGITYITEFAAGICRDAGFAGVAQQMQIFAKLSILALGMPVLYAFLATVGAYL